MQLQKDNPRSQRCQRPKPACSFASLSTRCSTLSSIRRSRQTSGLPGLADASVGKRIQWDWDMYDVSINVIPKLSSHTRAL
jgi:hypothetical protein